MIGGAVHSAVLISAFAIAWFIVFFCLLPIGLGEVNPETGAPVRPMLLRKALVALVIAAALWVLFYVLIAAGVLQL